MHIADTVDENEVKDRAGEEVNLLRKGIVVGEAIRFLKGSLVIADVITYQGPDSERAA